MAIESLTYLDIPVAARQANAAKAINRLVERMNEVGILPEQRKLMADQVKRIENWMQGTLPAPEGI